MWESWEIGRAVFLSVFNALVIGGNLLVVITVASRPRLHTTTNFIILSLATADFLLGVFVLPSSLSIIVANGRWLMGTTWCTIWLAVDVFLCTASIYNLLAISLDRFLAVTRPMKYKMYQSHTIGKYLVGQAWIVSLLISVPPLIAPHLFDDHARSAPISTSAQSHITIVIRVNNFSTFMEMASEENDRCSPMSNSMVYVIYSSCGSFWLPLLLIIFLNIAIFTTARTVGQVKPPMRLPKKSSSTSDSNRRRVMSKASTMDSLAVDDGGRRRLSGGSANNNIKLGHSSILNFALTNSRQVRTTVGNWTTFQTSTELSTDGRSPRSPRYSNVTLKERRSMFLEAFAYNLYNMRGSSEDSDDDGNPARSTIRRQTAVDEGKTRKMHTTALLSNGQPMASTSITSVPASPNPSAGRTSSFLQARSYLSRACSRRPGDGGTSHLRKMASQRAERRVARTVSYVVGCFVACWMPFFVVYTLQVFDKCRENQSDCVPDIVSKIAFWLGYANSAFNPVLYAILSREIRWGIMGILGLRASGRRGRPTGGTMRKTGVASRRPPEIVEMRRSDVNGEQRKPPKPSSHKVPTLV